MATKKFLDDNGLLYLWQKIRTMLNAKVDNYQGTANGGKILAINSTTGLVEPIAIPDTGVLDVEVDGASVVTAGVAEIDLAAPLATKQDALTSGQLAVLAGNVFTTTQANKLAGIETGAEVNTIVSVSVNGVPVMPDVDREVGITVPTALTQLSDSGFTYVQSVAAGSSQVIIGGTAKNPTIDIVPLEMPDMFTSTETETGAIGTVLQGLDLTLLTAIISGATLSEGDTVVFANGVQAQIVSIDVGNDEYDAVIISVPIATSFPAVTGEPMDNTALAALFNGKQSSLSSGQLDAVNSGITSTKVTKLDGIAAGAQVNVVEGATLNGISVPLNGKTLEFEVKTDLNEMDFGVENEGAFFTVGLDGEGISFVTIQAITNSEIDGIMA